MLAVFKRNFAAFAANVLNVEIIYIMVMEGVANRHNLQSTRSFGLSCFLSASEKNQKFFV
jgi:hypothetical protein